jgi:hypothetical protein
MKEPIAWPLGKEYDRAATSAEARSGRIRAKNILSPRFRSAPAPAVTTTKMADARSFRTSNVTATTATIAPRPRVPPMLVAVPRRVVMAAWRSCPNQA